MIRSQALVVALLLLGGCAGEARRYPSLAPRAAEKQGFAEPVVAPAAATPDAALDTRIAAQSADLARIAAGFTAAADTARRSAEGAKRQPVGSEAWLNAQAALAKVDDWRTQASALAADVEALASQRAGQLQPAYPALDALAARAAAESDREAQVLDELQRLLPAA